MTITVHGSIPKFDQNELERRQESYKQMYLNTRECKAMARAELPYQFLKTVIKMTEEGFTLDEKLPIRMESLNYSAFMTKPQHVQDADLALMIGKAKEDYIVELEAKRAEFKQLLTAQLLQAAQDKERKREEEKEAKLLREIQAEVNATFAPLVIPA